MKQKQIGSVGARRHSHVLDGAAESVRDASVVDRLLTEAEVRQLDVSLNTTSV